MEETHFRLATQTDRQAIITFMNTHWDVRHPLINLPDFFEYYYQSEQDTGETARLHFALAQRGGALVALAGYIPASLAQTPDIWVSLWVADKAAKGSGLELMAALPQLTGCRTLACNNIRPETRPFYEFLGYTTGRVSHFYRLADRPAYAVARIAQKELLPAGGDAVLRLLSSPAELAASGFIPPKDANPYKDLWYISRRYFSFPRQSYRLYAAALPGEAAPRALLTARLTPVNGAAVLRLVDYIGPADFLPQLGRGIDTLLAQTGAEYADIYCAGLSPETLAAAGFTQRLESDANIIPTYLDPPVYENIEYYYFTSRPEHFTLFKADGDQDRPNIPVE